MEEGYTYFHKGFMVLDIHLTHRGPVAITILKNKEIVLLAEKELVMKDFSVYVLEHVRDWA